MPRFPTDGLDPESLLKLDQLALTSMKTQELRLGNPMASAKKKTLEKRRVSFAAHLSFLPSVFFWGPLFSPTARYRDSSFFFAGMLKKTDVVRVQFF